MKTLLVAILSAVLLPLTVTGQQAPTPAQPTKKNCPLCKLPGRAALFGGALKACPKDCPKLCCRGTTVTYLVNGLSNAAGSRQLSQALSGMKNIRLESTNPKASLAVISYDPGEVKAGQLTAIIEKAGLRITGEQISLKVTGLDTDRRARAIEEALTRDKGIRRIETVCHVQGTAVVTFDPARTSRARIEAAINSTGAKVSEEG